MNQRSKPDPKDGNLILNRYWLSLFTIISCLSLGCVSTEDGRKELDAQKYSFDLEYPYSWPERIFASDCSNISGKFHASGDAVGYAQAPLAIDGRKSFERVLGQGTYGGDVEAAVLEYRDASKELFVTFYGQLLQTAAEHGKVPPKYLDSISFNSNATCSDGEFVVHRQTEWGGSGESNSARSELTSYLSLANDGSLVVKSIKKVWVSRWFGLVIDESVIVGWYKFQSF